MSSIVYKETFQQQRNLKILCSPCMGSPKAQSLLHDIQSMDARKSSLAAKGNSLKRYSILSGHSDIKP